MRHHSVFFFSACERKYSHFRVPYRKTQVGKQFIDAPAADGSPFLAASLPPCLLCPLVLKDKALGLIGLRLSQRFCRPQIYFQQTCNYSRRQAHRLNIGSILLWKRAAGCFQFWQYFSKCVSKSDLVCWISRQSTECLKNYVDRYCGT